MLDNNFIGPRRMEELPLYEEYFGPVIIEDDCILHNGSLIPIEITLSTAFDDEHCERVKINGIYYYFG